MSLAAPSPTLEDVEIVLTPAGGEPRRLTPLFDSMRWTSAAVGGFGSFSASFPGGEIWRDRRLLEGAMIRMTLGQRVLWEGQIEDPEYDLAEGSETSRLTGFGLRRLLAETSLRRGWINRDILGNFTPVPFVPSTFEMRAGNIDPEDDTARGLALVGDNTAEWGGATFDALGPLFWYPIPSDTIELSPKALFFTVAESGIFGNGGRATVLVEYQGFADEYVDYTTSGDKQLVFDPARTVVRFRMGVRILQPNHFTPQSDDYVRFTNIRILNALTAEDEDGGFYGGTLLRDLLAHVPGLTPGVIEDGSEFLIQQLEHHARVSALSIAEEIAAYYPHELAVWEDGRVDWTSPSDEPHWVVTLDQLNSLNLQASLDRAAKTTYLQFPDVIFNNRLNEESYESADPRNAYVRQGRTKDEIVQAGFPMTSTSAAALAQKLNSISGGPPPVAGRATLAADRVIRHADGSLMPAWAVRAGENLLIPDLPVSEPFRQGMDGATLFHIVTCDVNLDDRTVTLELDGQTRRADTLMARIAAATRVVTG